MTIEVFPLQKKNDLLLIHKWGGVVVDANGPNDNTYPLYLFSHNGSPIFFTPRTSLSGNFSYQNQIKPNQKKKAN
jgi:hypothetical protein